MAWAIYLCFVLCFVVLFWFVCGFAELDAITLNDDGLISLLKTMDKCNFQPVRFLFLFCFSSSTKAISRNDYNSFLKKPIIFFVEHKLFPFCLFQNIKNTNTHTHIFPSVSYFRSWSSCANWSAARHYDSAMRQTIFGNFRFKLRICADVERYIISVSVVAMKNDSTKLNLADFISKPKKQRGGEVKREK